MSNYDQNHIVYAVNSAWNSHSDVQMEFIEYGCKGKKKSILENYISMLFYYCLIDSGLL